MYETEMEWDIDNYLAERDIERREAEERGEDWTGEPKHNGLTVEERNR